MLFPFESLCGNSIVPALPVTQARRADVVYAITRLLALIRFLTDVIAQRLSGSVISAWRAVFVSGNGYAGRSAVSGRPIRFSIPRVSSSAWPSFGSEADRAARVSSSGSAPHRNRFLAADQQRVRARRAWGPIWGAARKRYCLHPSYTISGVTPLPSPEAIILTALAALAGIAAIRRRVRGRANPSRPSRTHEPLIRQNHQDWKDAVYNPKEHRRPRPPCG